jgi:hypothetical protein
MEGKKWEKVEKCQNPTLEGFNRAQQKLAETKTSLEERNQQETETKHEKTRENYSRDSPFFFE